jgi:hypothetical protein
MYFLEVFVVQVWTDIRVLAVWFQLQYEQW